ncbi:MAG TPA: hypothetical protein VNJ02_18785 [Vicinamibacterales bacterium]|nr:hypothetical protein [Vicinamibacterales bacterium]
MDRLNSLVYFSEPFARAYRALMNSLGRGQSLVVLIAPQGAARNALWRGVVEEMAPSHLEVIGDGRINAAAIGRVLTGHSSPMVVVENADDLPGPAFTQLERLLDPVAPIPAAQILLVGSERLAQRLRHPDALALAARVTAWSNLAPDDARAVAMFMGEVAGDGDARPAARGSRHPLRWAAAAAVLAVGVAAAMWWPRLQQSGAPLAEAPATVAAPPQQPAPAPVVPLESSASPQAVPLESSAQPQAAPLESSALPQAAPLESSAPPQAPSFAASPPPATVASAVVKPPPAPPVVPSPPPQPAAAMTSAPTLTAAPASSPTVPASRPASSTASSSTFSEADALARGRALAARGEVRAVLSLQGAMSRRPEGIRAETSAALAVLVEEAQAVRSRIDRDQLQKTPRVPQPRE